jgi:putative membrane protein
MMDGWDGMSTAGWLVMTAFWVALLAAIVWVVLSLSPGRRDTASRTPERPEDILDRRLAQGEIDAQAYDELRATVRAARTERE